MLGGTSLGRLAIAQEDDASTTTIILVAARGLFALTGSKGVPDPITFQIQEAAAFGSFAVTGKAATFQEQLSARSAATRSAARPRLSKLNWSLRGPHLR